MEMLKLAKMLIDANIPFEVDFCLGTVQLCLPNKNKELGDVVCHRFSYGGNEGLLEIKGFDITVEKYNDEVLGYLVAEEAFKHILNSFSGEVKEAKCI